MNGSQLRLNPGVRAAIVLAVGLGLGSSCWKARAPWWERSFAASVEDTLALGAVICAEANEARTNCARAQAAAALLADERILHPGGGGTPVRVQDVAFTILEEAGCVDPPFATDRRVKLITGCEEQGEWTRIHIVELDSTELAAARTVCESRQTPLLGQVDLCGPPLPADEADRLFREGKAEISRAGEHPTNDALRRIVGSLVPAALSGHRDAQVQLGNYVFGYWLTDEMFWPEERPLAVVAIAMLRVRALRGDADVLRSLPGLAKSPFAAELTEDLPPLPPEWGRQADEAAQKWMQCHPDPPGP